MKRPDLKALDRRLVPVLAARLRGGLDRAEAGGARARAAGRRGATSATGAMVALDDRLTRRGPLALAREVPQLALLVVAAVFLAGAGAALSLSRDEQPAQESQGRPAPGAARPVLGAPPGTDIDAALGAARAELVELVEQRPEATYVALVSLTGYLTPSQAAELLDDVPVQQVYLRASGAGPESELLEVPLTGSVATVLEAVCERTAERRTQDAAQLTMMGASVDPTSEQAEADRTDFEQEATRARLEALAFGGSCATAVGALVEGTAAQLAEVSAPQVRGVQVGPPGAGASDVDVVPVLPDQRGVVPQQPMGDLFR